jgi:RNA polymerase sigma-70 factor (ECF subfamily)
MDEQTFLAQQFDEHRNRLRAVAYRMLGSLTEADDAVQEAWLRLSRTDHDAIDNLGGWLTTVTARVCLNMLRSRRTRSEASLDVHVPDPIVTRYDTSGVSDPAEEALLADAVGLALLVVLETLAPRERLAFVLHDMFSVPFDEIAAIVDRSPDATRQLASRARRRVQGAVIPETDMAKQRAVVDAFFAAAREGDFEALVSVLDPDVVLRSDGGSRVRATAFIRGADEVAAQALTFAHLSPHVHPALVNGMAGVVVAPRGRTFSVMSFTVSRGKIVEIDALTDPERLRRLELPVLD